VAIAGAKTDRMVKSAANKSHSLRATISRNVKVSVTAKGVKFVLPKELIEKWEFPGRDLDRSIGWRHPVFGDKETWVTEHGNPWWANTLNDSTPDFRDAVLQAVQETLDQLGG
jgi:hypothetical protein